MPYIEFNKLDFSYADGGAQVLQGIQASFDEGEFVCILGHSGCGKSTLLRLIAGLEKPTAGEVLIDGAPVTGTSLERGVVFQDYGLFPWMTAGDNIMLALEQRFPQRSKAELETITLDMLGRVGLDAEKVARSLPKSLSGGMKQRCAIAQAFAIDPPVLLMDEPFGALDAVTRARLQDLVLELWAGTNPEKTVFFVTHDVDEALLLAQHIIVLGQSPSHIIYDYQLGSKERPTREDQFSNPEVLELRNKLIAYINTDIVEHVAR